MRENVQQVLHPRVLRARRNAFAFVPSSRLLRLYNYIRCKRPCELSDIIRHCEPPPAVTIQSSSQSMNDLYLNTFNFRVQSLASSFFLDLEEDQTPR